MRKIKIKNKEESRKRMWAIVFLILMTFSTVGYSLVNSFSNSGGSAKLDSEGFVQKGNYWTTSIGDQEYSFSYLPSQVEDVTINGSFNLGDYYSVPLYFTEDDVASFEILNNLGRYILRTQKACISSEGCGEDLPVKNCSVDNVVVFVEGADSVRKDGNCVYLSGDSLRVADKFLYEVLKI